MNPDPLAKWRGTAYVPREEPPPEPEKYEAFDSKDKVFRLRICCADDSIYSPGYNLLLCPIYDRQGTYFILPFTVLSVVVRGTNLQTVIRAIEKGMADYIQEFTPALWPKPTDATAPFIESIEVKITEGALANGQPKHGRTAHGG